MPAKHVIIQYDFNLAIAMMTNLIKAYERRGEPGLLNIWQGFTQDNKLRSIITSPDWLPAFASLSRKLLSPPGESPEETDRQNRICSLFAANLVNNLGDVDGARQRTESLLVVDFDDIDDCPSSTQTVCKLIQESLAQVKK